MTATTTSKSRTKPFKIPASSTGVPFIKGSDSSAESSKVKQFMQECKRKIKRKKSKQSDGGVGASSKDHKTVAGK